MKHIALLGLIFILVGCSSSNSRRASVRDVPIGERLEEPRKRVFVLPFLDADSNRSEKIADVARRTLIRGMLSTNSFIVLENSEFPKDFNTFRANDQYDFEAIGKVAGGLGVALAVEGRILDIKAKKLGDQVGVLREIKASVTAKVQVRVWAIKQGREVMNEMREATIESSTREFGAYAYSSKSLEQDPELIRQAVAKATRTMLPSLVAVSRKISWEGRIAKVSGDRIYINAGRLSGIQVGDILRVNDEGSEVFDPETGLFIGRAPGKMKGTVEVISYFGKDGAIGVIHSGSGFRETDQVEFY